MVDINRVKDHNFETITASGMVYLTLDHQLVFWQRFDQHIKVNVVYDKVLQIADSHIDAQPFYPPNIVENVYQPTLSNNSSAAGVVNSLTEATVKCHDYVDVDLPLQFDSQPATNFTALRGSETLSLVPRSETLPSTEQSSVPENLEEDGQIAPQETQTFAAEISSEPPPVVLSEADEMERESHPEETNSGDNVETNERDYKGRKRKRSSQRLAGKAAKMSKRSGDSLKDKKAKVSSQHIKVSKSRKANLSIKISLQGTTRTVSGKRASSARSEPQAESTDVRSERGRVHTYTAESRRRSRAPKVKKLEQEKDVKCEYCQGIFKSQQEYFDHRKGDRTSYKCRHCSKIVPFKAHLMVHMRKHDQTRMDEVHSSDHVGNQLSMSEMAAGDTKGGTSQSSKGNIRCDICGLTVSNIPILKTHTMIHTGEYAYKCCVCGEKTHSIAKHNNHMATHLKAGKVQCKICNISFESRSELSKHQLTHEFKCSICAKTFPNKTSRVFHYKMAHKDDIIRCDVCGKMFSSRDELQPHLKYHRNRAKTQCTICGLFVTRLDNHMLSHNQRPEDAKMYVCDQCPKQFRQKLSFQRHLRTHSEEKPYACMECPKRFARSGGLRRHMVTHTHEKPFVCEVCGKACSQMGNLRIHMQIHKDTNPVQCQECGETFAYKNALQEHMRSMHYMDMNALDSARYLPSVSQVYYIQ